MAGINSPDTILPWPWAIEYFSSCKEIDLAIVNELIDGAPEFPKELTKNTRERVAFRFLEDLIGTSDGHVDEGPFAFDLSKSCDDVLQSIMQERSDLRTGGELLKWDIYHFIKHKRTSMPKCALEQLKDAILEGTHSCTSTLKELSGLVRRNDMHNPVSAWLHSLCCSCI